MLREFSFSFYTMFLFWSLLIVVDGGFGVGSLMWLCENVLRAQDVIIMIC